MAKIALAVAKDVWFVILTTGVFYVVNTLREVNVNFVIRDTRETTVVKYISELVLSFKVTYLAKSGGTLQIYDKHIPPPLYKSKHTVLQLSVSLTFSL